MSRGNPPPAVLHIDSQVVDVYLAAFLFELFELIGRHTSNDFVTLLSSQCDEAITGKQPLEIRLVGLRTHVCVRVVKGVAEHSEQFANQFNIAGGKPPNPELRNLHRASLSCRRPRRFNVNLLGALRRRQ